MAELKFKYGSNEYAYYLQQLMQRVRTEIPRDTNNKPDLCERTDKLLYASAAWLGGYGGAEPSPSGDGVQYVYGDHVWNDITVDDVIEYINAACNGYEGQD